jgi:hypothetical protein
LTIFAVIADVILMRSAIVVLVGLLMQSFRRVAATRTTITQTMTTTRALLPFHIRCVTAPNSRTLVTSSKPNATATVAAAASSPQIEIPLTSPTTTIKEPLRLVYGRWEDQFAVLDKPAG